MQVGIIQGRLSRPVAGHIQQFPKNWEREFELIKRPDLNLNHIEWLITAESFKYVLTIDARRYADKITSIGCDNLTNKNISSKIFLDDQLDPICQFAIKNNIKSITIPLLEKSKIDAFVDKFIQNIEGYGKAYPTLRFNFELESPAEIAVDLCNTNKNFFLTYDTGNITSCGLDHEQYIIACSEFIDTVHLKDKSINPIQNVEPGTGDAPFDIIFSTLALIGFSQNRDVNTGDTFTLQTNRGRPGSEINTILRHKAFFKELHEKFF